MLPRPSQAVRNASQAWLGSSRDAPMRMERRAFRSGLLHPKGPAIDIYMTVTLPYMPCFSTPLSAPIVVLRCVLRFVSILLETLL